MKLVAAFTTLRPSKLRIRMQQAVGLGGRNYDIKLHDYHKFTAWELIIQCLLSHSVTNLTGPKPFHLTIFYFSKIYTPKVAKLIVSYPTKYSNKKLKTIVEKEETEKKIKMHING